MGERMNNPRNTLVVIASLAVVLVIIALGNPVAVEGQPPVRDVLVVNTAGNPVPVSVQNGVADEKLLITLIQDVTVGVVNTNPVPIEFGPFDVGEFNSISILGSARDGAPQSNPRVDLFFAAESGSVFDPAINTAKAAGCGIPSGNCGTFSVGGPFLIGFVSNSGPDAVVTVKAYLSK